jgi:hypothetical protein
MAPAVKMQQHAAEFFDEHGEHGNPGRQACRFVRA